MAYNVLKGTVAGSVDQYGDQHIEGTKVFKNTISASVFYDTDAESPCATLKDVPFQKLDGGSPTAVVTYQGENTAKAEYNLTFDGTTLKTKDVRAERLFGSAEGLVKLPADQFVGKISAHDLSLGGTLQSARGRLQIKAGAGIEITSDGAAALLHPQGALSFRAGKIEFNAKQCADIRLRGQNLSDDDIMVVYDASRGDTRRTTLQNFYSSYIKSKALHPEGPLHSVQLKGKGGLAASSALVFDPKSRVLGIDGKLQSDHLQVQDTAIFNGDTRRNGAVFDNITTITSEEYEVGESDYTILADTTEHRITLHLPMASENCGRILVIKKINVNKFKLNSHPLVIKVGEGLIDFHEAITLKHNYSIRRLQSDGANWWIIGKTGS